MINPSCANAGAGLPALAASIDRPIEGRAFLASGCTPSGGGGEQRVTAGNGKVPPRSGCYRFVKRAADIVFALLAILVLFLPMLVIAIVIKLDSKGPVFFKQKRIGKNQAPFYCYKFRTMITDAPKDCPPYMFTNPEAFITKVGRWLRKSSLDELPQLFNILKGEMTFVGPRPCTPKEVELIQQRERFGIFELTPGLTGWAQVNGRDEISIAGKVMRDREYARRASVGFDLMILWRTVIKVIKREGVHEGQNEKNVIR